MIVVKNSSKKRTETEAPRRELDIVELRRVRGGAGCPNPETSPVDKPGK